VQRRLAVPLAAHWNAVFMDAALFARLDTLHARRDVLGLTSEQRRLLERVHLDFVRAGARLQGAARERYRALQERLAELTTAFAQNVLHDEENGRLVLPDDAALDGLPPTLRAAAREAAAAAGLGEAAHVIPLARSFVVPFLTFSRRRDLRERLWRAWVERGAHDGGHDNRPVVREILALRREQAQLHGHDTYADYALADTMAQTRTAVARLLDDVWPRALAAFERERGQLREAMDACGAAGEALEPWDWHFWAERVRVTRYAVDDAEVKPYFRLEAMVQAAFDCAQRLFGITFAPRADLPVYHPDVKAYEVRDASGCTLGVFLHDNFAREGKRSGAWMSALRWQHRNAAGGAAELPVILNNNNFVRSDPALLSMDDVRTLFHEFGHGLHGLLSDVTYRRLSGPQVLRDFVELPSQLFEHWALQPAVLKRHARHWRTGEPIGDEAIARLQRAHRFNQGFETVRYLGSALVDMAVHSSGGSAPLADPFEIESCTLRGRGLPAAAGVNHRLAHFQHLFSGSAYAAGYYVYLWAEVLDADAFEAFVEAGDAFDARVAAALRRHIYASGDSVDPRQAWLAFRGRAADPLPMLRKKGLVVEAPEPA
jgi:peptidyl-dipeptidase Dcp